MTLAAGIHENENNEAREVEFLKIDTSKKPQGLSPLSSASLNLRTHTSSPCAIFEKSRRSIFFFRYATISGGSVTVKDSLSRGMQLKALHSILNTCNRNTPFATDSVVRGIINGRKQAISGRFENDRPVRIYGNTGSADPGRETDINDRQSDVGDGAFMQCLRQRYPGDFLRGLGGHTAPVLITSEGTG